MKVLIIDDELNIREQMKKYLLLENIDAVCSENALSAQKIIRESIFDAVLVDLKMPGMDGLSFIKWVRQEGFRIPIIMISAYGDISDAVSALKEGAQDYVVKPFNPEEIVIKLKALVEAQNLRNIMELENRKANSSENEIIGISNHMQKIREFVNRLTNTTSTVLITGESGTGKEVVARNIHKNSTSASSPFVPINIGGVLDNLLESELFGYEKGAFTGALSRKIGMFEIASGGTLFLDEIGDMPMSLQVKLLRVLQEHCIIRLGSTQLIPINARIICATNKNLEEEVKNGKFREDLFYRLNVIRINIPPLRERKEDIPVLASSILSRFNRMMGKKISGFTVEAMDKLKKYPFYGNVRELENVIERAVIFTDTDLIQSSELELSSEFYKKAENSLILDKSNNAVSLKDLEKSAIINALERWEGNRTKAALELKISRRTLISKIHEFGLDL